MKADATQGKDLKQAKPQKPERQPALAKEAASQEKGGTKGLSRHVMVTGKIMADAQIFKEGPLLQQSLSCPRLHDARKKISI